VSAGLSQAWRLLGGLAPPRLDGAALRAWSDPGWIKVATEFRLEPAPAGTLLSTETRILVTDPSSRRFFAAYWFLIRASSAAIRPDVRSWCQLAAVVGYGSPYAFAAAFRRYHEIPPGALRQQHSTEPLTLNGAEDTAPRAEPDDRG
jgi:AraC-like DNA-binding protein